MGPDLAEREYTLVSLGGANLPRTLAGAACNNAPNCVTSGGLLLHDDGKFDWWYDYKPDPMWTTFEHAYKGGRYEFSRDGVTLIEETREGVRTAETSARWTEQAVTLQLSGATWTFSRKGP